MGLGESDFDQDRLDIAGVTLQGGSHEAARKKPVEYNRPMATHSRTYRTEAVVLRRQDLGEADRLLVVFTPQLGKLRIVAKGIRRPRSRKAGHLEPFTRVDLFLARGRELDIVTQAEAIDLYPNLRIDLIRLGHAAYAVELLDRVTADGAENEDLYRLLVHTLERLSLGASPAVVSRYYELRVLDLVGYRPELFRCLDCGTEIRPEDQFFSASLGGVLCPSCGPKVDDARPMSLGTLKVLRHYQRSTFASVSEIRIRPEVQADLERLLEDYLSYILERRLNSPAFVRQVRRLLHAAPEANHTP
jgi:DNA repair protein RecO (recombination protein O)